LSQPGERRNPEQTFDVASLALSLNSLGQIHATGTVLGVGFSHDFNPSDIS
jgi:hypothetical protein